MGDPGSPHRTSNPPSALTPARGADAAVTERRLGELLADEEFWTALSLLSLKLYGQPLAENGRPLGEVLSHLTRERAWLDQLQGFLLRLLPAVGGS